MNLYYYYIVAVHGTQEKSIYIRKWVKNHEYKFCGTFFPTTIVVVL